MSTFQSLGFFSKIGTKIMLICLMFSIPIATLTKFMVNAKDKDIEFAVQELKGNKYQRALEVVLEGILQHKWLSERFLNGETTTATSIAAHEKNITTALNYLTTLDKELGDDLQFTTDGLAKRKRDGITATSLWQKSETLFGGWKKLKSSENIKSHNDIITHIRTMITHAGDTSNLILDPDLDSYYLMDVTLLALPQTQDRIAESAVFVESLVKGGQLTQADRVQAAVYGALLKQSDLDRLVGSTETALNEDANFYGKSESLQKRLPEALKPLKERLEKHIALVESLSNIKTLRAFDLQAFRTNAHETLSQSFRTHEVDFDELDQLLSTRIQDIRGGLKVALQLTALALVVSALLTFWIARGLVKRIRAVTKVSQAIAAGNFGSRTGLEGNDEISQLGQSFDHMTSQVLKLSSEITAKNKELQDINHNLESMISERTFTIKTILDNVKFGFFLIDKNLVIQDGFSKSCHELLKGRIKAGVPFYEGLAIPERDRPLVQLNLEQVFQDLLPEDMSTSQLPPYVRIEGTYISLQCSPVRDAAGTVTQLLFTIADNTAQQQAERESHHHKILVQILKQIDSFRDYVAETKHRSHEAVSYLEEGDENRVRAELHTIKGNSAAFGLTDLASLVHEIEDQSNIGITHLQSIEQNLRQFLKENHSVLQISYESNDSEVFQLHKNQLLELGDIIAAQVQNSRESLEDRVYLWIDSIQMKPADALLGIIPDYIVELAKRLGKQVKFHLDGEDTLLPPERFKTIIKSMVHLIRNCVDHGIEFPYERAPKPEEGRIHLIFKETDKNWNITVKDDGKGIDFERLAQRAVEKGVVTAEAVQRMSADEKTALLFLDGLSTASEVTDISGRGVGMGAIKLAVEHAGGSLRVHTTPGQGSTFDIEIPKRTQHRHRAARRVGGAA